MVDFVGQKHAFLISVVAFALSVPISILYAFYKDNYLYSLYFEVGLTCVLMVIFGPNWPYLNLNKPEWRPDSDAQTKAPEPTHTSSYKNKGNLRRKQKST
ncbi:hypothetical protein M9Y10_016577 [Tritrichomonas musculus]|uniref:Signal peptidase complex subunit 1 n=1 Tax=Tritrichomonas musculus TaxID=1915356 RepID=A0ABR2HWK6_9EUKA